MPAYDFKCTTCAHIVEVTRPSSDDSPVACPSCGGATKLVFHPVGVHFKGTGFHNTDYRPKSEPAESGSCPSAGGSSACSSCPASGD